MDGEQMQHEDDDEVEVEYIDESYEIEGDEGELDDDSETEQDADGDADEEMDNDGSSRSRYAESARVEPACEDAKIVFGNHRDAVLAVRLNHTGTLAVTGGQDDASFCWDVYSGNPIISCTANTDSVSAVAFNVDSTLVATADMNGLVQVWNTATQQRVMRVTISEIEWISFHNRDPRALLCGHVDGTVTMWQIPKGTSARDGEPSTDAAAQSASGDSNENESLPRNKTLYASGRACSRGILFSDGRRLASAHEDGSVHIWNLSTASQVRSWERRDVLATDSSAKGGAKRAAEIDVDSDLTPTCIDVHRDDIIFAVGRVDGHVLLFHSQNGRLLTAFDSVTRDSGAATSQSATTSDEQQSEERPGESCESAVFVNALDVLVSGSLDGTISLFDLGSSRVRSRWRQADGAQMSKLLSFGDSPHMIATAGLDAVVRIYDTRNQQVVRQLSGHRAQILDADYSSVSRLLVTASDDYTARVFEPFAT